MTQCRNLTSRSCCGFGTGDTRDLAKAAELPGAPRKRRGPDLLHMVDLIMLALLVASDLALGLLSQLAQVLL